MAQFLLNDKAIRSALNRVADSGKPEILNDGGGLTLIVRLDGVGWWRLRYFQYTRENRHWMNCCLSLSAPSPAGLTTG